MTQATETGTTPLQQIGIKLRESREQKGLTLEKIAEESRIKIDYLRNLEMGDISRSPGMAFTRGFFRTYARMVGFNEEQIHGMINEIPELRRTEDEAQVLSYNTGMRAQSSNNTPVLIFSLVLVAAVIGVIAYVFSNNEDSLHSNLSSPDRQQVSEAIPELKPVETVVQSEALPVVEEPMTDEVAEIQQEEPTPEPPPALRQPQQEAPQESTIEEMVSEQVVDVEADTYISQLGEQVSPQPTSVAPTPMVLALTALESLWITLQVDNQQAQDILIDEGESLQWQGNDHFKVTIGNSKALNLTLNGQTLDFPQGTDLLVDYRIDPSLLN